MRILVTGARGKVGSGIAAEWMTASWPRTAANASPASARSAWK